MLWGPINAVGGGPLFDQAIALVLALFLLAGMGSAVVRPTKGYLVVAICCFILWCSFGYFLEYTASV